MCRSIKRLFNVEPPTTEAEIEAAALQFVRKVSGYRKPSQNNHELFYETVSDIGDAVAKLLNGLQTKTPPRDRQGDAAKARR